MQKLFLFLIVLINISFGQNKINIAVIDLNGEGVSNSETRIISSRLRTDLFNTHKYTIVEREKMNEILGEQGFQLTGCTSNECVIEVGKLLGVRQIVAGDIGKIGNLFTITIRLIDVQTGKIIKIATEDCECKIETVLTTSVKNVSQILSGQEVISSTYISENKGANNNQIQTNGIHPWEKVGLKREEFMAYQRSGKSLDLWSKDFKNYKDDIKNPFSTAMKSAFIPGWGQLTMNRYRGYLYIAYDIFMISMNVYWNSHERSYARSLQLPIHLLVNRVISSIDAGITSIYYNREERSKFLYGISIDNNPKYRGISYSLCLSVPL